MLPEDTLITKLNVEDNDLNDSFKVNTAINFISGNNTLSEAYLFNPMEDFSHFRVEFRYSF